MDLCVFYLFEEKETRCVRFCEQNARRKNNFDYFTAK